MSYSRSLLLVFIATFSFAAEPERLTEDGKLKLSPSFVGNGKDVVYSVHDIPNRVTLTKLNRADRSTTAILPTLTAHQFDGVYSRDDRYLCYARSASNPQLVLVILDTRKEKEFVYRPGGGSRSGVRLPSLAPDNSGVVFTQSGTRGHQIGFVDLQAKNFNLLTDSPGINKDPEYSPDGKRIVFASSRTGDLEIFVMKADGSDQQRLTKSHGLDMHPSWSPDGKRLAFTSMRDGNYEIYVMNADGSAVTNVSRNLERDDFATWSPDGQQLLLVSERRGKFDLYLIKVPANPE